MPNLSELFWQASLPEIKQGYLYQPQKDEFICLICGQSFSNGIIYPSGGRLYQAQKYIALHIRKCHRSIFHFLLNLDKKLTGLTEHQKTILDLFDQGYSDQEIAEKLDTGSISTIRNHRFSFRSKEKQAKIFLALMELLDEKDAAATAAAPVSSKPAKAKFPATGQENAKIITAYFKQGPGGPLDTFPLKEKKRRVILQHLMRYFECGKSYTEKEINDILKNIYHDYVLLRRCLIDFGLLERTADGKSYWVESTVNSSKNDLKGLPALNKRKELKLSYMQNPPPMGVYQIKDINSGKILVGSNMNLPGCFNSHRFQLKNQAHRNKSLQQDWNTDGAEAFRFEILETIDPAGLAKEEWPQAVALLEEEWLDKLQPYGERGYNQRKKTIDK